MGKHLIIWFRTYNLRNHQYNNHSLLRSLGLKIKYLYEVTFLSLQYTTPKLRASRPYYRLLLNHLSVSQQKNGHRRRGTRSVLTGPIVTLHYTRSDTLRSKSGPVTGRPGCLCHEVARQTQTPPGHEESPRPFTGAGHPFSEGLSLERSSSCLCPLSDTLTSYTPRESTYWWRDLKIIVRFHHIFMSRPLELEYM